MHYLQWLKNIRLEWHMQYCRPSSFHSKNTNGAFSADTLKWPELNSRGERGPRMMQLCDKFVRGHLHKPFPHTFHQQRYPEHVFYPDGCHFLQIANLCNLR